MNNERPINLDIATISLPITAIASILHRICAVITWVGLGFYLVVLSQALSSAEGYMGIEAALNDNFLMKFFAWGFLSAFGYYCVASLKHIIQDFGYFEDFEGGKMISWASIGIGVILCLLAGVAVWV